MSEFVHPIPTELPRPYKGVCKEIFSDLVIDRADFRRRSLGNLKGENPHLLDYIVREAMFSPDQDATLDWTLPYYEIFSRSAKKEGPPIVVVTEELIRSTHGQRLPGMERIDPGNVRQLERYVKEKIARWKGLEEKDIDRSEELLIFWTWFNLYLHKMRMMGTDMIAYPHMVFDCLYNVAEYLGSQAQANRIKNRFGK